MALEVAKARAIRTGEGRRSLLVIVSRVYVPRELFIDLFESTG